MGSMETPGGRARLFQNLNHPSGTGFNLHVANRSYERGGAHQRGGMPSADFISSSSSALRTARAPQIDRPSVSEQQEQGIEDTKLPVAHKKEEFLRMLEHSDIVIVTAPTGSGKSTQIPQFAHEAGYDVITLQPRRLATVSVPAFVASQLGTELGDKVGYRHALEQKVSPNSEIIFETDGYHLAREMASPYGNKHVLIIDEVHEFNNNIEALLAVLKHRMTHSPEMVPKLVIMSATLNADEISDFFGGGIPVLNVPGRSFPIEEIQPGPSIAYDAVTAALSGKNSLVFLPGKSEIAQMQFQIERMLHERGGEAKILPLHSKLSRAEQDLVFKSYSVPKIVLSTNVAQTSITIEDMDVVICSGLVRRIRVKNGVEALVLEPESQDGIEQKQGRVGRTRIGYSIYHGPVPIEELTQHAPAEIQNSKLESVFLKLLSGREFSCKESIERLEFLHKIPQQLIDDSFTTLHELGLVGPRGHITDLGEEVASLPVGVRTGKMLLAAEELSRRDPDFLLHAIDVAAVMEVDGVTVSQPRAKARWQRLVGGEHDSDMLAQAVILRKAQEIAPDRFEKFGLDPVGIRRANEIRAVLLRRFGLEETGEPLAPVDRVQREQLLEAIAVGMIDSVYRFAGESGRGEMLYRPLTGSGGFRMLSRDSVLDQTSLVVGTPFDIAIFDSYGDPEILPLLTMASRVSPDCLRRNRASVQKTSVDEALKEIRRLSQGDREGRRHFRNSPRGLSGNR